MGKLVVDPAQIVQLLSELRQRVVFLTHVLLQHLHGELHLLSHPDLHLQLLLHVLNVQSEHMMHHNVLH